jgi:hypothetical protein
VSLQAACSVKKRVPKTIIQEGKKGARSLIIVFIKIRVVMGLAGEIGHGESGESPRSIARIK